MTEEERLITPSFKGEEDEAESSLRPHALA